MKRESNIELLRLVIMCFIVLGHINNGTDYIMEYGGVRYCLSNAYIYPVNNLFSSITCVGVDTFVLISGFFGIKFKLKSFINLMVQMLFYSVLILAVMSFVGLHDFVLRDLRYLFPVSSGVWWFMSSYITLFAVAPLINKGIENSSKVTMKYVVLFLLFLDCFSCFFFTNQYIGADGYSFFNMLTLYIVGRYIALYGLNIKKPLMIQAVCCFIVFGIDMAVSFYADKPLRPARRYCDILVITMAVCMLMSFRKMNISNGFINKMAKSTLAIYLIHVHPCIYQYVVDFGEWINSNFYNEILGATILKMGITVGICFVCILIDQIRIKLCEPIVCRLEVKIARFAKLASSKSGILRLT